MWPESRTYVTPTPRFTVEEVLNGVVRREYNIALIKAVRAYMGAAYAGVGLKECQDIVDDFLANVDKLKAEAENKKREADREAERVARETVLKVYQILDDRGTYQQALGDVKALLA
jgi:dsRNA-specific ribonuclease